MSDKFLSIEEIISFLRHTSEVNLIVEGKDDGFYYRRIEEKIASVEILVCNGRELLLNLFSRRMEYSQAKCVFIADQDLYLFQGIPPEFNEIVWTNGYSIENDLVNNSSIPRLLDQRRMQFEVDLELLKKWYSNEISKAISSISYEISKHPREILEDGQYKEAYRFLNENVVEIHPLINEFPYRSIRGKNVVSLICIHINRCGRESRFNDSSILDTCWLSEENDFNKITLPKIEEKCRQFYLT